MKIQNRTVLVTGGATGIGLDICKALVEKGNEVLACARTQENLDAAARSVPGLITYRCDITDASQRRLMLKAIAETGHEIDVLVNNAALMSEYDLSSPSPIMLERVENDISTNLAAPISLALELVPQMMRLGNGIIVNFNSPAGVVPIVRNPLLSATKSGLLAFSQCLRYHLRDSGIRVVNVFPPGVDTPMTKTSEFRKMPANLFVEKFVKQLEQGKNDIWVGEAKAIKYLARLSKRLSFGIMSKQMPVVTGSGSEANG